MSVFNRSQQRMRQFGRFTRLKYGVLISVLLILLNPIPLTWNLLIHPTLVRGNCEQHQSSVGRVQLDVPRVDGTAACLMNLSEQPKSWVWARNNSTLGFSFSNSSEETVYLINDDDDRPRKVLSIKGTHVTGRTWWLSPDGKYIIRSSSSPSYGGGNTVINVETSEGVCHSRSAPGDVGSFSTCDYLPLADGQWWHFNSGIVLPEQNAVLASENIRIVKSSPDKKWILLGHRHPGAGTSFSLYHEKTGLIYPVRQPTIIENGSPCAFFDHARWRPDSSQFALYNKLKGYLFIFSLIQESEPYAVLVDSEKVGCVSHIDMKWSTPNNHQAY